MSYDVDKKLVESFDPALYSDLVEMFKEFDKNGNAVIEQNEFEDLVKALGFVDVSKEDIAALFKEIDLNKDSTISFAEFLVLMKKMTAKKKRKPKSKK